MNIREVIDKVDGLKPNTYSTEDKVRWLSHLEASVYKEVINKHHPICDHVHHFEGFDPDFLEQSLKAEFPHDEMYVAYLKMKIDEENGETARYNNSATLYNSLWDAFCKDYHSSHKPFSKQLKIF